MKNTPAFTRHLLGVLNGTVVAVLMSASSHAASPVASAGAFPPTAMRTADAASEQPPVNYVVRVQWTDAKGVTNHLQVLTTEGQFSLDSLQKPVKINDAEVPTTVKLQGTLRALNSEKGRITLFLGRTVPYVTGMNRGPGGTTMSSYQQLQVGLSSTFGVTFGKPQVIQADENGEVSILVNRQD